MTSPDAQIQADSVLEELRARGDPEVVKSLARYGIRGQKVLGIKIPVLRQMAKEIGKNHSLALALWVSEIHEARILAAFIDDPKLVTEAQMEDWVVDFDSWDVCDQVIGNLFDRTDYAYAKVEAWSLRQEEFVKRAGFVMMASLAVHDKKASDEVFLAFLPAIVRESNDNRNFVKKAVNWALRQIGKRNARLREAAIETAKQIRENDSSAARWIASDALRELTS